MASALSAAASVQARIARALRSDASGARLGTYTLRDEQRETVTRILAALQRHGGALLADAAGSGKTLLALAVAAQHPDALVLVPAAVRDQWERAAARAGVAARLCTHEAMSRGRVPAPAGLIVVDEAHHFRSVRTQRYRALAQLAAGRELLLLTATPVVNRRADRDALLALFLGSGAAPDAETLAAVVLRRAARPASVHRVQRIPPLHAAADVPGITEGIAQLPPAFPALDGSAATALLRISLAMAWRSSLAALDAALRRRQQRGEVLAAQLLAGRWPTRDTLRAWIHGDDATQLALDFDSPAGAAVAPADATATIRAHLAALARLRSTVSAAVAHDTATRAAALRALLAREGSRRVLLLAQHTETIRALYRALRDEPGVVAIVGQRVFAAAGRWSREDVLRRIGPGAAPWSPRDPCGVRLVLASDILAEGVELQGCATLVHGDAAWTPARLEQRVGRVARVGQRDEVHVTQFVAPATLRPLLQLARRLQRKREARATAVGVADARAALQRVTARWTADGDGARVAAVRAARCGFLAVLCAGEERCVVGAEVRDGQWRVSRNPRLLLRLAHAVRQPAPLLALCVRKARRVLQMWLRQQRGRALLGDRAGIPAPLARRVRMLLDRWLATQPLARRQASAREAAAVMQALGARRGVGIERAVSAALEPSATDGALQGVRDDATDVAVARLRLVLGVAGPKAKPPIRLDALLILRRSAPDAPAPPSTCSGSAAPR